MPRKFIHHVIYSVINRVLGTDKKLNLGKTIWKLFPFHLNFTKMCCQGCWIRQWLAAEQARSNCLNQHYNDVIMSVIASQIIGVSIVSSTVRSSADKKNPSTPHLFSKRMSSICYIHTLIVDTVQGYPGNFWEAFGKNHTMHQSHIA